MATGLDVVRLLGLGLSALLLRCARGSLIHDAEWVKNEAVSDGKESGRGEREKRLGRRVRAKAESAVLTFAEQLTMEADQRNQWK